MRPLDLIPLALKRAADVQPRFFLDLSAKPDVKARDCVAANAAHPVLSSEIDFRNASILASEGAFRAPHGRRGAAEHRPGKSRRHRASAAGVLHPSAFTRPNSLITDAPSGVRSVISHQSIRNERMSHRHNRIAAAIAPTLMLAVYTAPPALADEGNGQGAVTSASTQSAVTGSASTQGAVTAQTLSTGVSADIPVVSDAIQLTSAATAIGGEEGAAAGARAGASTSGIAPAVTGGVVGGAAGCAVGGFAGALVGAMIAPEGGALPGAAIGCAVGAVGGAVAGSELAQSQAEQSATA
jgi:hypothetical protein